LPADPAGRGVGAPGKACRAWRARIGKPLISATGTLARRLRYPQQAIRRGHPMQNATAVALSALTAQQRALDVTAGNIANANTPGYRSERMVFSDWLLKQPGGQPPGGGTVTYAQDRATYRDPREGTLSHTGNPFDIAIGTNGFFTVQTANGPRLTRAGHFELSPGGTIADDQGDALLDTNGRPLQLAPADTEVSIAGDGTISSQNGQIGKIGVVAPADPQKMMAEGGRLFDAVGPTQPVAAPKLAQGAIEGSNVQPTLELTRMMNDLRQFQFITQLLQGESDRQQAAIEKLGTKQ
jgi:flagellar basal-body rod protein FlgF